ncbi:hypothetical protein D9619_012284 [Psilocybe cf. subviscida]|uniref:Uncharacterized protein n=1 Tax=Psilocybe cf. subviscida TaxID=2480587 RepID=A0A8H5EZP2_9AGAR|nr:hypothetical protein D9619_012284 [Psilocybe cf. subviscida]
MSLPIVFFIYINIHSLDLQANTVLSSGRRGRVTQRNTIHHRVPVTDTHSNAPSNTTPQSSSAIERRVEAQPRIRRKLKEVSAQPRDTLSRMSLVALLATEILSVVEKNIALDMQLVDLAMDAHAVAYIARLTELLGMIHGLLVGAAPTGNIVALLKKVITTSQRKVKVMRMREDLLNLLRRIERNKDADLLSSLNAALDCHYQHSDVDAAI